MANGKTDTHQNEIIDHYTRGVVSGGPYTAQLALYSVAPTETTAGTELTGNGYARIAAGFSAPANGVTSNAGIITFTATGTWLPIVGHALVSATDDILYWEDNVAGPTLGDTDKYEFGIGDVTLTES